MARVYLGQGLKFPYQIDVFGKIAYESDSELIKQSLRILFSEPVGTEFFREHYGSRIREAMFEPNDAILRTLLDYYIVDAIEKWERRIKLVDIIYDQPPSSPSLMNCKIVYLIRQSSEIDSYVYPFYRSLKD